MRTIKGIIIHATATRAEWMKGASTSAKIAEVKRWHVEDRKWSDIGYHFLIDRDGTVAKGRPIEKVGAHVAGHNTGTVGISLFGGHGSAESDAFADNFTPAQDAALRQFIADLQERFGPLEVTGHNQYAAKACPGFFVPKWLRNGAPAIPTVQGGRSVPDPVEVARWRLAAIRDAASKALDELPDPAQ